MGLSDLKLFLPELYLLFLALLFFVQSLWPSPVRMNHRLALWLSAVGVAVSVWSLPFSGELFYRAYRVDLFSQAFKVLIQLGLFLVIVHRPGSKKYR